MDIRQRNALMDLTSSDSDSETSSNSEFQVMKMAKKKKGKVSNTQNLPALSESSVMGTAVENLKLPQLSESSDTDSTPEERDNSNASIENTQIKNESSTAYDREHEDEEVSDSEEEEEQDYKSETSSSSSSSSSSDSQFDDGYDENFIGNEADRQRLTCLTEKERETEIFKRIEQRDMMRKRWEIERKLKLSRKSEEAKKGKKRYKKARIFPENEILQVQSQSRSPTQSRITSYELPTNITSDVQSSVAAAEYIDSKERSKERKRNVEINRADDKRNNAMALLKAQREEKAKREEEDAQRQAEIEGEDETVELKNFTGGKSMTKLKASEVFSDSDAEGSDTEKDKKPHSSTTEDGDLEETQPKFINSREELNKLRLSRFKMERLINLPMFERTVLNCFVRINVGINSEKKSMYRVAEILGVVETAKIYNLGKVRTNKGLRLKHAGEERVMRLEFISNQEFTESEFTKWRTSCMRDGVAMPSADLIEKKLAEIESALNYVFKEEDVNKIIEERNRFRNRPTNYAMKKTCLMKERDAAMLRGDYEIVQDLNKQIEELENQASELDRRRSESIYLIAYINDRNRKRNIEDAEKAILQESRANKSLHTSDPFTRRITQPRMVVKEPSNENKVVHNDENHKLEQHNNIKTQSNNHAETYNPYACNDFDIDLDLKMPESTVVTSLPKPIAVVVPSATKGRSINLEEYKKKRGLI